MNQLELSAGTIEYTDTRTSSDSGTGTDAGPALVFLHGLLMDASLWTR